MKEKLFSLGLTGLVLGLCSCERSASNQGASSSTVAENGESVRVAELRENLWEAIRARNAEKFLECYFIEERFDTPMTRETNKKDVENLLKSETIDVEIQEIPKGELAEIMKIQSAKPDTLPRYSLVPKKMVLIRQQPAGRRFLIGERSGKWHIVTFAGHTT